MRKQVGIGAPQRVIDQRSFQRAIVARLVMLQPGMRHMIAERQQKMIVAVMPPAEQGARFLHQILQMSHFVRSDVGGAGAIGGDMQEVRRTAARAQVDGLEIRTHQHRGIDSQVVSELGLN